LLCRHPSPIGIALRHRRNDIFAPLLGQYPIAHLNGKAVLQIVDADLANVLRSGAGSADFYFFETTSRSSLPSEDGEWDFTDLAFFPVRFLGHADVGVVAEAGFAD
jgi:hypothetical protein